MEKDVYCYIVKNNLRVNSYHKVKLQNWQYHHISLKATDLTRQSRAIWQCFILKRKKGVTTKKKKMRVTIKKDKAVIGYTP